MKLNLLVKRYTFNILVEDESDFETLRIGPVKEIQGKKNLISLLILPTAVKHKRV